MQAKTFYDMISAVKQGEAADVRALLKKGARPNVLGQSLRPGEGRISALAIAIERADVAIVEVLLLHGANPHDIDHVYSAPAAVGATTSALHFLCGIPMLASRWCAMAERLLAHGVAIDARNRAGLTALQLCQEARQDERRSFLVDWGAAVFDASAQPGTQGTPAPATLLHALAQSGRWRDALLRLVKAGADIDVLDPELHSPLDRAVARVVRVTPWGAHWAGPALQAFHGWIAVGARPSAGLLAAHPPSTAIGDALRMYRIDAAVACGDQLLVWHVLENTDDKGDADCQAAGARLDLDAGHPDMEEVLDLWLASGFGEEV